MSAFGPSRSELEAVFRIERPRLIAALMRHSRDVSMIEDIAQDALLKASMMWSSNGIPQNPGGWLFAVARNRFIDRVRHTRMADQKLVDITHYIELTRPASLASADEAISFPEVGDDILALMFITCHPLLSRDSRITLTLRLVGGLTVDEIARAFQTSTSAIEQRIVRAKRELVSEGLSRELPEQGERDARLDSVMEVIYLVYNEGYAATAGATLTRPALCSEGLRLGRMLAHLKPEEPEVLGLLALMELQCSRLLARQNRHGLPVPLDRQDRSLWDRLLIRRGLEILERACRASPPKGWYLLQALISACHARAASFRDTNWPEILARYDALFQLSPTYIVALNRAVAVSWAMSPAAAMAVLKAIEDEWNMDSYPLYHATRADLLSRLGFHGEATAAYQSAAVLSKNIPQKLFLAMRAEECSTAHTAETG